MYISEEELYTWIFLSMSRNFSVGDNKYITKEGGAEGEWMKRIPELVNSIRVIDSINVPVDRIILRRIFQPPEPYGVLFTLAEIVGRRVHFRKITFYERSDKFSYSLDNGGRERFCGYDKFLLPRQLPVGGGTKERGVILYHKGETILRHGPKRRDSASCHAISRCSLMP